MGVGDSKVKDWLDWSKFHENNKLRFVIWSSFKYDFWDLVANYSKQNKAQQRCCLVNSLIFNYNLMMNDGCLFLDWGYYLYFLCFMDWFYVCCINPTRNRWYKSSQLVNVKFDLKLGMFDSMRSNSSIHYNYR